MKRAISLAVISLLAAGTAGAADLMSVYKDALASDPTIRQADAIRKATQQIKPEAWAALLPQITGQGTYTRGTTENSASTPQAITDANGETIGVTIFPNTQTAHPKNRVWSINLTQNLFSWTKWSSLQVADSTVAQAEADYRTAEQALLQRVAQRYFGVLAAQDTLEAQQIALEAFNRQLDQANKRFEVGLIAITDVQDSKAARDQSNAAVIEAKRALASAEEQLREVTGQKYEQLSRPGAEMPLASPAPADEQEWVNMALDQNTQLLSSRLGSDIARENVRVAFGGHLPEINLVGAYGKGRNVGDATIGGLGTFDPYPSSNSQKTYGVQVQVPIFAGGGTQARVKEQQYRWIAAKEGVTATSRATERATRDAYLGVISEMARVEALKQAVQSSDTSLKATEAGYEVGTRTSVDVLDQRRQLVANQTTYLQSRYTYLTNVVNLRQAAGTLDEKTLAELNALLTESVRAAPTAPNSPNTPAR
ncbi:MAG: TolC family outer membrane protein [Gammaproteobacteria bacterium]